MIAMYHLSHLIVESELGAGRQDGMPGGPRISMPYSAATAAIVAGSGGRPANARTNSSNPPGSVTSRKRACGETTSNVCATSRGP